MSNKIEANGIEIEDASELIKNKRNYSAVLGTLAATSSGVLLTGIGVGELITKGVSFNSVFSIALGSSFTAISAYTAKLEISDFINQPSIED